MEALIIKLLISWSPAAIVGAAAVVVLLKLARQDKEIEKVQQSQSSLQSILSKEIKEYLHEEIERYSKYHRGETEEMKRRLQVLEADKVSRTELHQLLSGWKEAMEGIEHRLQSMEETLRVKL